VAVPRTLLVLVVDPLGAQLASVPVSSGESRLLGLVAHTAT
jgi:hypothetical protein